MLDHIRQLVLATIQGLAEVFPVSSSGHVAVLAVILGDPIRFERIVVLHLGTSVAIAWFFREQIVGLFRRPAGRRLWPALLLCLAATAVVALLLKPAAERLTERPRMVAMLMVLNGLVVLGAGALGRRGRRGYAELGRGDFAFMGLVQGIAVLPGISRLGLTLSVGLMLGMTWREALRLSFLLSLPLVLGANLLGIVDEMRTSILGPALQDSANGPCWACIGELGWLLAELGLAGIAAAYGLRLASRFFGQRLMLLAGLYCIVTGLFLVPFLRLLN